MRWALILLLIAKAAWADVEKRAMPDYDGRGEPPTTAGEVLIWVPRVIFAPLWLVSDYVVRRPIGFLVVTAERERWPTRIVDFLFDRPIGIVPTFYADLGLRPTGGFYFFWNGLFSERNQIRATASFSADVITATLLDRFPVGDRGQIAIRGALSRRSDNLFYGLGPDSLEDNLSRYEANRLEGSVGFTWKLGGLNRLGLDAGVRSVRFGDDSCCDDPTVADRVAAGVFASPAGLAEGGHDGEFAHLRLQLDSRPRAPATGVALFVDAEQGSDPASDRAWLRAAATLAGSVDVTGTQRIFSLSLHAAIAEPLAGDDVPFTEQVTVGGSGPLPGFTGGRLVGRSALAATLRYEWPVWSYLAGVIHAGAGDVFDARFDGFAAGKLRASTGIGMRSLGLTDHRFELLLAIGTRPFDDGGQVDSVRLVFGGVAAF